MENNKFIVKKQQGFTLVEVIVGMSIMIIIMSGILGVLVTSYRSQQYNFDETANTQEGRQIIMKISTEIKNATEIISPVTGGTANTITYRKNGDTGNRSIYLETSTNTVIITDPAENIIQRLAVNRSDSLSFERESPRKIAVTVTLKNSQRTDAPSNRISTVIYTLN